jgi:hypothetical protein
MKGEWISVKEKLPDNNDDVWVARAPKGEEMASFGVGWMSTAEFWRVYNGDTKDNDYRVDDVTHWMPIPPLPPKPDPVGAALKMAAAALREEGLVTRREALLAIACAEAELLKGKIP